MKAKTTLTPRRFTDLVSDTCNLYESTVLIAKRSKQIVLKTKEELNDKLAEFVTQADNLEEVFENKEHIEISKFYEKQPKPATIATEEFLTDKLTYRYADEDAAAEA